MNATGAECTLGSPAGGAGLEGLLVEDSGIVESGDESLQSDQSERLVGLSLLSL